MKNIIAILTISFLSSCQTSHEKSTTDNKLVSQKVTEDYPLIGQQALLTYPEFKAEVSYLSDSTLHWKTTTSEGKISEGSEKVFYKKLNDHQYFLNWIEQDGLSISQVIDVKEGKVTAFGTFADDKSPRGKRSSITLEGTFDFVK